MNQASFFVCNDQPNFYGTRYYEKFVLILEFQDAELYKKSES